MCSSRRGRDTAYRRVQKEPSGLCEKLLILWYIKYIMTKVCKTPQVNNKLGALIAEMVMMSGVGTGPTLIT